MKYEEIAAVCRRRGAIGFYYDTNGKGEIDWYRLRYAYEETDSVDPFFAAAVSDLADVATDAAMGTMEIGSDPSPAEQNVEPLPFAKIPQAMRAVRRWCVWKKLPDGRKIPYRVLDGGFWSQSRRCKSDTPDRWVSYEAALHCFLTSNGHLGGLSFALGDGWCGFDFDGVIVDGQMHPQAASWLERLGGYREVSQSVKGEKTILRGVLRADFLGAAPTGRQFKNIPAEGMATEVYHCRRFFFLTGNGRGEPMENPVVIDAICAELLARKAALQPKKQTHRRITHTSTGDRVSLSDEAVLEKIRHSRQASTFEMLWNGQIGAYASASEADMALTAILMWWCQNDTTQVVRLFERSGLAKREKWDREDYQERTLAKAARADGYRPRVPKGYAEAVKRAKGGQNG